MTRRLIGLLLLLAPALVFSTAIAAPAAFYRTGHYQLKAFGELDPQAKIYLRVGRPQLLVVSGKLSRPVLVVAGEKTVQALEKNAITPDPEDEDGVLVDTEQKLGGELVLKVSGSKLSFIAGGKRVVIEQREALLGDFDAAQLLAELPEFRRTMADYEPQRGQMLLLGRVERKVRLQVFMASWCPHCERLVPRLMAVLEQLGDLPLETSYRLVPRNISDDLLARQHGVNAIPTIVITEGESEIGRLSGQELERPEAGLARVLFGG